MSVAVFLCRVLLSILILTGAIPAAVAVEPAPSTLPTGSLVTAAPFANHGADFAEEIAAFYRARSYRPVWAERGTLNANGVQLVQALMNADKHGIDIVDALAMSPISMPRDLTPEESVTHDRQLTELFLFYAQSVSAGRIGPDDAAITWDIRRPAFDARSALEALNQFPATTVLAQQPPRHDGYQALVAALAHYRALAVRGGWPTVPDGPVLEYGRADLRVATLRRRLVVEADLPITAAEGASFDREVEQAVTRFQRRNGLTVDGRVGRETLAALNVSARSRMEQIELNLERWRWMPRTLPNRRIEVNIAAAEFALIDNGEPVLSMRTIVGSPRHPTPILENAVRAIVINPYWHVPTSITVKEILPRLRREPDYLMTQDIRIVDRPADPYGLQIDWRNPPKGLSIRLRQQPGPLNALGQLKFEFPNRFDVYMHDTPGKTLFNQDRRALSHGCVRLKNPTGLANLLLANDNQTPLDEVLAPETRRIALRAPTPVYLLYWTAFVDAGGQINFREDIYRHDARMSAALGKRYGQHLIAATSPGGCPAG